MKKLFLLVSLLMLLSTATLALAKTAHITFTTPTNETWKTLVIYGTEPYIVQGLEEGTYTAHGQISEPGASSVDASGFIAGTTYYFTALREDANGEKSEYATAISFKVPDNIPTQYEALPKIEIDGHVFTIQITVDSSGN